MAAALIGVLLAAALVTNVPLGMWRSRLRRFSPAWFVAIHASIPLLLGMRFIFGLSNWVIPPEIILAFAGQFVGARLQPFWSRSRPGGREVSAADTSIV